MAFFFLGYQICVAKAKEPEHDWYQLCAEWPEEIQFFLIYSFIMKVYNFSHYAFSVTSLNHHFEAHSFGEERWWLSYTLGCATLSNPREWLGSTYEHYCHTAYWWKFQPSSIEYSKTHWERKANWKIHHYPNWYRKYIYKHSIRELVPCLSQEKSWNEQL